MDIHISQETCCNCNVIFWITTEHRQRLVSCKNTFYCPNGHPQSYQGDTDRVKLQTAEKNLAGEKAYSERLARSNAALRGVITRKKSQQADK